MPYESKPLVMTSIRLRSELHSDLRKIAFHSQRSLHSLLIEGAKLMAAKYQENPDISAEPHA